MIPELIHLGGKPHLLRAVLVATLAWVPPAAVIVRPPTPVHVPHVRLVPEIREEAIYEPSQCHGSVLAPIAHAQGEEWLLRVRGGFPHELMEFCEGLAQEPAARLRQVLEDDCVDADVGVF